jgi:hypothetical protein
MVALIVAFLLIAMIFGLGTAFEVTFWVLIVAAAVIAIGAIGLARGLRS